MRDNIVLADFDCKADWKFIDGLRDETGENYTVKKLVSNKNHAGKFQNLIRYFKYFLLPLEVFVKRKRYSKVIAWQQFFGLILALYCRFFNVKDGPDIYIMTFIYNQKGKLYESFVRYCLGCKYVKRVFVYSESEVGYYAELFGISEKMFKGIELGIDDVSDRFEIGDNGRYLTAGRSNRDYDFLLDNWDENTGLDVICDCLNERDRGNICFYRDVVDDRYLEMLSKCHAVVISLKDEKVSSGQLVILQAMMLRKPVICTFNSTISSYIDNYKDGLIIDKNRDSLLRAMEYVDEHYTVLIENGRAKFEAKYSVYQVGVSVGRVVKESCCGK